MDSELLWHNGRLIDPKSRVAGLSDPGMAHGLAVFETFRLDHGDSPLLDRHLRRLTESAAILGLEPPDRSLVDRALATVVERGSPLLRVRMTSWKEADGSSSLTVSAVQWNPPPARMHLTIERQLRRQPPETPYRLKSHAYNIESAAYSRAVDRGFDEALLLTPSGNLAEGSRSSLFLFLAGEIVTPPLSEGILPGVTRAWILENAEEVIGARVIQREISERELGSANGGFLTNGSWRVVEISAVDDIRFDGIDRLEISAIRSVLDPHYDTE